MNFRESHFREPILVFGYGHHLVAVICCVFLAASFALAQPKLFPQALSDPKFLSNLTWKSDKGIEALVKDWPPYTEDQGFDDKTVLSSTEITILVQCLTLFVLYPRRP